MLNDSKYVGSPYPKFVRTSKKGDVMKTFTRGLLYGLCYAIASIAWVKPKFAIFYGTLTSNADKMLCWLDTKKGHICNVELRTLIKGDIVGHCGGQGPSKHNLTKMLG